ncbi:MAG: hypothetical protein AAB922_03855 [Patescibacteria group bacterium]
MSSATPNLGYLREQADALKRLLDDLHPGLASWVAMYERRLKAITEFWAESDID